jgi:hypothetical protein
MAKKERTYTEKELEIAYCLGFLNRDDISVSEIAKESAKLKDRFKLAVQFINTEIK